MHVHRSERIWLICGVAALVIFLAIIGVAAVSDGIVPPSRIQTIDPTKVAVTAPFDRPGLRRTGPHAMEAYVVAHIFSFKPSTLHVPTGTTVTFYVTTPDVVHGFFIAGTAVNMMVVPGWVSSATHTFAKPGTYLLLCNEYCGSGHHFMYGTIEVR
jgi:cytochrome c oxidase subunit II